MAACAPGDYYICLTLIEGNRIADLQWGTANAKYAVLRFAAMCNITTNRAFCVSIHNGASSMCWVSPTLSTSPSIGIWQEYSLVVPPCTSGTWPNDTTLGMFISFCVNCGTTFQTANTGTWLAANYMGTSAINVVPGANQAVYFTEVGLHADPNMTGVAPPFQQPHYEDDLRDCMRYWYKAFALKGITTAATTTNRMACVHPVPMRVSATPSLVGASLRIHDGTVAYNITSIANVFTTTQHVEISTTATGGAMTLGKPAAILCDGQEANYIACSARM